MGSSTGRTSAAAGSLRHGPKRLRLKTLGVLAIALLAGLMQALPAPAESRSATVGNLEVDGRGDDPLGVDDTSPRLGWRVERAPDGWAQGAYQVRAARSERDLARGSYLWDSGKVRSSAQNDVEWGGPELRSRETVVWQVRVWSTRGDVTGWSRPGSWEMGLLERSDWGASRWIEYPGRSLSDPLPIFARAFSVDRRRGAEVVKARLYLSGIGIHEAELNGRRVSDEVLAPGNSNYQLSAEYRTYDVTRLIRPGANTLGVELGNGTALVTRSVTNPATGRTAPYAWWQSQFKGSGTLAAPGRCRRHGRQSEQRRWLLHRWHYQHRYGRRRRSARVAHDHRDRHRRCGRHRHHVRAGTGPGARGRSDGHRLRRPDREHRTERGCRRHAADDRPARDHEGRRLGRHDRQRPLVEGGVRPDGLRHVVLRLRLRLAEGAARVDGARGRPRRDGGASRRLTRRVGPRRHRPAAQPDDRSRLACGRAGRGGRPDPAGEHHGAEAGRVGVRPRPELRRLAGAPARRRRARGNDDQDAAGGGAERGRDRQPGLDHGRRRPARRRHLRHLHHARDAARPGTRSSTTSGCSGSRSPASRRATGRLPGRSRACSYGERFPRPVECGRPTTGSIGSTGWRTTRS